MKKKVISLLSYAMLVIMIPATPYFLQAASLHTQKFDAAGNELPWNATEWAILQHPESGLMWEMKSNDASIHNRAKKFTWCNDTAQAISAKMGTCGDGTDTIDFIRELNDSSFGGYTNWRLPTVEELSSLLGQSPEGQNIDLQQFPNNQAGYYWSSSTYVRDDSYAWFVNFSDGLVYKYVKSNRFYVRAVRK